MLHCREYVATSRFMLVTCLGLALCACHNHESGLVATSTTTSTAMSAPAQSTAASLSTYVQVSAKVLANCNLDIVNGKVISASPVTLQQASVNEFGGWIDASGLIKPVYWLRFDDPSDGRYLHAPFHLTIKRPDVVAVHPSAPEISGFSVLLAENALPAGEYHAYLSAQSAGATYVCDSGRHIDVVP